MTTAQSGYYGQLSLPLAQRVSGGGMIWMIGRVILGGLFLTSALAKFMDLGHFADELAQGGIPISIAPMLAAIAVTVEFVGGLCITLGFVTNGASLLMILFTIIAALVAHRFWEFSGDMAEMQMAHFTKNMMIAGAFCMLYVAGGGPYSIDRALRQRDDRANL